MKISNYFYKDEPIFGLDIGYSTIKVMQTEVLESKDKHFSVSGYGIGSFPSETITDGVIKDFEKLAEATQHLFENNVIGNISTRKVALSVPASKTYTRTMVLPQLDNADIAGAVRIEAEQYIPMSIDDLYLDHSIIASDEKGVEILAVAVPKVIIDSYYQFARVLGLDPVAFDTSILAAARLFKKQDDHNDIPAVLVDFGSMSTDITIHDKTVILTSTIPYGGDMFSESISEALGINSAEAHIVKSKYGISKSKKQAEILQALKPTLNILAKEIQRMIRFYEERSGSEEKIGQIVSMGGGANMPGLSDYLTDIIRLPVRTCEPLRNFNLGKLNPPSSLEKSMYVTVAGLSLITPSEVFLQ